MIEETYEKLNLAHRALRMDIWTVLLRVQAVPPFSSVSDYTNLELVQILTKTVEKATNARPNT